MCCEDIAIGRSSNTSEQTKIIGAASEEVASASLSRIAIILCAPLTGTLTYSIKTAAVAGAGIIMVAGNSPIRLTIKDHGSLVRARWMAIGSGAGLQATVYATELPDSLCDVTI
jgi:hypothetical protein